MYKNHIGILFHTKFRHKINVEHVFKNNNHNIIGSNKLYNERVKRMIS